MEGSKGRLVLVDDDQEMRSLLEDYLSTEGFEVISFASATEALAALSPGGSHALEPTGNSPCSPPIGHGTSSYDGGASFENIDALISDIKMPQLDGLEFTTQLQKFRPDIPVILITAFGSIETAIEAMKRGAFHYLVKPFKLAEIGITIDRALEFRKLKKDNSCLRQEVKQNWKLKDVIGKSPGMKAVFDLVSRVSQTTTNVLITGESGTGKEIIARAIHSSGPRAHQPFVAINCSAIPETLLESELFGHAKGSFTGAIQRKKGLFEEASGGTLFLDEIGDMDAGLQAKLLRVIQEKKVRPVGDNIAKDVNVRIIAATHKDLKAAIKKGTFRDDLFYRLSVIPIVIPPLRERREDIPLLAQHFLNKFAASNDISIKGFTKRAMTRLMNARWEGNVRELENLIERAIVLSTHNQIDDEDLAGLESVSADTFFKETTQSLPSLAELEQKYIQVILERTSGRKDKAAQILGINRRTLYRKEREYGLVTEGSSSQAPATLISSLGSTLENPKSFVSKKAGENFTRRSYGDLEKRT